MRRHGELFQRIIEYDNLELAYHKAALGRRYQPAVLRFHARLDENLIDIQNSLLWRTYEPGPYHTFTIWEPKERLIYVAPFRDRVIHHAVMNIVAPIWDRLFIYDSYACRGFKGAHRALYRLDDFLREAGRRWGASVYCLKGDIHKFFPSINHHRMMFIIEQKIKCPDTLWLFRKIIFSNGDPADPGSHDMPIGNLISQWGANLYLNALDYFVKHDLNMRYYIRYMDDFIILHNNISELRAIKRSINGFIGEYLNLLMNPKSDIFCAERGIDFLGYRTWVSHRLLRKSSIIRASRRFKKLNTDYARGRTSLPRVHSSVMSWVAHCRHAPAAAGKLKCIGNLIWRRDNPQ